MCHDWHGGHNNQPCTYVYIRVFQDFVSLPTASATTTTVAENLASGYMPVVRSAVVAPRSSASAAAAVYTVVYPRGPIAGLPEEHASRRARFEELDSLQAGWTVELRQRSEGGVVDAVFFAPDGAEVGLFAAARRKAMS